MTKLARLVYAEQESIYSFTQFSSDLKLDQNANALNTIGSRVVTFFAHTNSKTLSTLYANGIIISTQYISIKVYALVNICIRVSMKQN